MRIIIAGSLSAAEEYPIYLLYQIPNVPYASEIEAMMPIIIDGNLKKIA